MNTLARILICIFCCIPFYARPQNIVPNHSFEQYTLCPNGYSQVNRCVNWLQLTGGTSDYFHTCGSGTVAIPSNIFGYQHPAHANAYVGGYTYVSNISDYKEYVAAPIPPMIIGVTYEVSMSVSLSDSSGWATNDLGIHFYDTLLFSTSTGSVLPIVPKVSFASYGTITDTNNWVRLTGYFTADSAYDNIVIGGFMPYNTMTKSQVGSSNYAYYYIDSVDVRPINKVTIVFMDSMVCAPDSLTVNYIVPAGYFQPGNKFTLQLSNASGSFVNAINIGTVTSITSGTIKGFIPSSVVAGSGYRIRIISSNPVDSSLDNGKNISIGTVIPAIPVASSNAPVCINDTLRLFATDSTPGVNYWWEGPNNFKSTQQNPKFKITNVNSSGDYVVAARLFGCFRKDTINVVVKPLPSSSGMNASSNTPCFGDTLKLTSSNTLAGTVYSWVGPNGFTSSLQNPVLPNTVMANAGTYILTVMLNGCSITVSKLVVIKEQPQNLTAASNSPLCEKDTVQLISSTSSTGTISFSWTGPNGFTSSAKDTNIISAVTINSGDYIVTATKLGCSSKDTVYVLVKPVPSLSFSANSNTPICVGDSVKLYTSMITVGTSINWLGPNSFMSSVQNPVIANAQMIAAGNYKVTATLNGCSIKDSVTVTMKSLPQQPALTSNSPVCPGATLNLTASSGTAGVGWSWTGANSYNSGAQNPTRSNMTTADAGKYYATATLNGCFAKDSVNVVVHPVTGSPIAGNNSPVCVGGILNLTSSTVNGATYSWAGPNGFSSTQQNPVRTNMNALNAGTYSVTAIANGCLSAPATTTVSVVQGPSVSSYVNPGDTICIGDTAKFVALPFNAGTSPTYQWYQNGNPIPGATTTPYATNNIANGDVFYVMMTAGTACNTPIQGNSIKMTVLQKTGPVSVKITVAPDSVVWAGLQLTFTALPVNCRNPQYQWKRNGVDIIGGTVNPMPANHLSNGDKISCVVTCYCSDPGMATSNVIKLSIDTRVGDPSHALRMTKVYPNPVSNQLTIEGIELGAMISLYDVTGRKLQTAIASHSKELIDMSSLAAGTYMLQLQSADGYRMNVKVVRE
jgi:hypothetical protein